MIFSVLIGTKGEFYVKNEVYKSIIGKIQSWDRQKSVSRIKKMCEFS